MESSKILVVDDKPGDLKFVAAALSESNYALAVESDPRKALKRFEDQGPWHLVISDLRMRHMHGLALLKRIKGYDPSTEAIIITARADTGSAIKALNLGAFGYVAKPFHRQELRHCVARALDRQRLVAEQQRLIGELEDRDARRRKEIATIASMGDMLSRMRSPTEISEVLLKKITAALGAEGLAIFLLDEARNALVLTAHQGLPQGVVDEVSERGLTAAETALGHPVHSRKSILIERNAALDPRLCTPAFSAAGVNSFLRVPLESQDEPIGCIEALILSQSTRSFTPEDREFLEAVGHIVGNAIQARRKEQHARDAEKMAAVGELAAGVAHELGNALGVAGGTAQFLLANTALPSPVRHPLEVIYRNVAAGQKIIKDLLWFARPSPPCRVATAIESILDQALLFLKREMAKARVEVSQHYWPDPFQVLADPQQMQQVFLNILLNAIQAMPRGGTLILRTIPEPTGPPWTGVRIEIADTGDGIPAKHLHQIFEPFFTTKEEGTGLGLSVSRRIIAAHGGELSVESKEGQGTRFMVRLPIRPPTWPPQPNVRGSDSAARRGLRRDA
jgi:signal transduction histidine kinase/CheY-like chemotaxis protein